MGIWGGYGYENDGGMKRNGCQLGLNVSWDGEGSHDMNDK
jgi:hypothetical protein